VIQIPDLKLELLPHPPYLPDLEHSDFYLFWPLQDAQCGRQFRSDEEGEAAVRYWVAQQTKCFFFRGFIFVVVGRRRRRVERDGDGIED
jgi:hypothetical protein